MIFFLFFSTEEQERQYADTVNSLLSYLGNNSVINIFDKFKENCILKEKIPNNSIVSLKYKKEKYSYVYSLNCNICKDMIQKSIVA